MNDNRIDVKENDIYRLDKELLSILLTDRSSKKNIVWATDNYAHRGICYQSTDEITIKAISGRKGSIIKPRTEKSKKEQIARVKEKAEVFTPSWVCNKQNNLVDNAWFGAEGVFNVEHEKSWTATTEPIQFPTATNKSWQDYVNDVRLEITCGEAPYLVSRYDAVSGVKIEISQRVGLLDRKLRVVGENTDTEEEWLTWAIKAFQNIYGYDWQGDNVLLARENLLFTFIDYYQSKFNKVPDVSILHKVAEILSWNIWQMDGLKFVIPGSCRKEDNDQMTLFDSVLEKSPCPGCACNDPYAHTGIYCIIKDWKKNRNVPFVSMLKKD